MIKGIRAFWTLGSLFLLVLAACAPSAQPAAAPAAPAAPAPAAPAAAPAPAKPAEAPKAAMPKRGGTFVVAGAATTDPVGWAPTLSGGHSGASVWNMISCNLVKWDNRPGHPSGATQVIPDLAESWENPTPTKYVFHLRKGVKTNTGKEVTSEDVKWTLELLTEKSINTLKSWYGEVDLKKGGLETPDPYTVIFNLPRPDADFLTGQSGSYTSLYFNTKAGPTEDKAWTNWGGFYSGLDNIDGCGAWKGVAYQTASHIIYERRADYWELGKDGKPLPYLDRIEHRYIFDHSAQIAALRAGQIMAIPQFDMLPLKLADSAAKDNPNIVIDYYPGARNWPLQYDLYAPPFNDVRVRRALSMAIDRDKWIKSQFNGRAKNGYTLYPVHGEWFLDLDKEPDTPGTAGYWWHYHPQEAKKLLAEAGYPNGFKFMFRSAPPQGAIPALEVFAAMMKEELNVTVDITPVEYAVVYRLGVPDNGMYTSWILRPELKSFTWALSHPDLRLDPGHNNRPIVPPDMEGNKEFRDVVIRQQQTLDPKERLKLVHQMQRIGAHNFFQFYFPMEDLPALRWPYVKDWEPYMGWSWGEFLYTWLDK